MWTESPVWRSKSRAGPRLRRDPKRPHASCREASNGSEATSEPSTASSHRARRFRNGDSISSDRRFGVPSTGARRFMSPLARPKVAQLPPSLRSVATFATSTIATSTIATSTIATSTIVTSTIAASAIASSTTASSSPTTSTAAASSSATG